MALCIRSRVKTTKLRHNGVGRAAAVLLEIGHVPRGQRLGQIPSPSGPPNSNSGIPWTKRRAQGTFTRRTVRNGGASLQQWVPVGGQGGRWCRLGHAKTSHFDGSTASLWCGEVVLGDEVAGIGSQRQPRQPRQPARQLGGRTRW